MTFSDYGRLLWGALIELAFGVAIFVATNLLADEPVRTAFVRNTASDWLAVTGQVLFPAAVAVWITYVNIESSSFGDYLRYRFAAGAFHFSFAYPGFVFFAATVSLIFTKGTELTWMPALSVFLLAYSMAVFVAMVLNVATVMRLYGAFRAEMAKEQGRGKQQTKRADPPPRA